MPAHVVLGAQWGEESKDKITQLFCEFVDVLVRPVGGPNPDPVSRTHYLPSVLVQRQETRGVIGPGVALSPALLLQDVDYFIDHGMGPGRLTIDPLAPLVLPHHEELAALRAGRQDPVPYVDEATQCYADVRARQAILLRDVRSPIRLRRLLDRAMSRAGVEGPGVEDVAASLESLMERVGPLLGDAREVVDAQLSKRKQVLFEGTFGAMLDACTGHYPYCLAFETTAKGLSHTMGLGPAELARSTGVAKAYVTRRGPGPLPSQIEDLRIQGHLERFGAEVDAESARYGWLDVCALRAAVRFGGIQEIALTKLDALTGLETLKLCVEYEWPDRRQSRPPSDVYEFFAAKPLYEEMPGWGEEIGSAREWSELPEAAKRFIRRIEMLVECPIALVSVGDSRAETVIIRR